MITQKQFMRLNKLGKSELIRLYYDVKLSENPDILSSQNFTILAHLIGKLLRYKLFDVVKPEICIQGGEEVVIITPRAEFIKWLEDCGFVLENFTIKDLFRLNSNTINEHINQNVKINARLYLDLTEQYDIYDEKLEKYRPNEDGYINEK